ncbi:motility associated factor glycosyltransferase family protein [Sediminispirochaeta smaragdinae]|uniref:6-hydroxymethylpterin diphosphokinase MptE-like domain-containing protein n=1 Tax=Sediminispirochaeta smaragdinae (strain DSM 11293 / JCM 15392 / SEBR 4228) TaxID=573413 RepID=E1R6D7_SEDSS|nr:6-hydroxymethylpterin diphosphokinase MptE-like protein [Sediminispirochaeta smaragdinae]ADK80955.1 protein of unknown function DUF115 [Sediminispirochaeta smaragdinae DSM 11293]
MAETSSSKGPLLQAAGGGLSCFYANRNLYHYKEPVEKARQRADAAPLSPQTLYILPSPLLWYGVDRLLERIDETSLILAVEIDEELYNLAEERRPSSLCKNERLVFLKEDQALGIPPPVSLSTIRRVRLVTLNGGYALAPESYRRLVSHYERYIRLQWQNRMTLVWFGPLWLKNFFYNCAAIANQDIIPLRQSKLPILIAGAGPSLEEAIPLIERYRKQFLLLAVDTALSPLKAHGLDPDLIVCQDGQYYTMGDFITSQGFSTPLLFDLTAFRGVPRHQQAPLLPFLSSFDSSQLLARFSHAVPNIPLLPPVGSVGVTALLLAQKMKPPALLLAGLDFSYRLGKSHCRGTPFHHRELQNRRRLSPEGDVSAILQRHPFCLDEKQVPPLISDFVLSGYEENFTERLSAFKSAMPICIFPGSLPSLNMRDKTGKRYGHDPARFLSELEKKHDSSVNLFSSRGNDDLNTGRDVQDFLLSEQRLLRQFVQGDRRLWKELDYLYRFFPDFHRIDQEQPDDGFFRRTIASAQRFIRIIEQALSVLRS